MTVLERFQVACRHLPTDLPPFLEQYTFSPTPINYGPHDAEQIRDLLLNLALQGNNDPITTAHQPPSYLLHQVQVMVVAEELMRAKNPHLATMMAGIHDAGRSKDNGIDHVPIGYDIAQKLGLPPEVANIALLHHQWGLGIEPFGSQQFDAFADMEESSHTTMGRDPTQFLSQWQRTLNTQEEDVLLAALATLIGDNSKMKTYPTYPDGTSIVDERGNRIPFPRIAIFDRQLGQQLLNAQIERGSYKAYSKEYWREYAGMIFLLNCISYFEQKTGIVYREGIERAKKRYNEEVYPQLLKDWEQSFRAR